MRIFKQITAILLVLVFFGIGFVAQAQTRVNNKNAMFLVKRLEINADQFRNSLDFELVNDPMEEIIEARVAAFEMATDRLRERIEEDEFIPVDMEDVLSRALLVERALQTAKLSPDAREDWMRIRNNLDALAKNYRVAWVWTLDANPYWKNTPVVEQITDRLDSRSDEFRRSFNYALDVSALNGTELEDRAVKLVQEFEDQLDRWEELGDRERLSAANVELLLKRAIAIETFLRAQKLTPRVWRDWAQVKANLDELAMMANVSFKWNVTPVVTGK